MKRFSVWNLLLIAFFLGGCGKQGDTPPPSPTYYSYQTKFPRCAGSYEPEKCDAQELALSKETPADVEARKKRLDDERRKNMDLVNSNSSVDSQQAQPIAGNSWYTFDVNHAKCFASPQSPADRMREIQASGFKAITNDISADAVEVGQDTSHGFEYSTYFRTMGSCVAALPKSQPIPFRYE